MKEALKKVKDWEEEDLQRFVERWLDVADDRIFAAYVYSIANAYGFINNWNFVSVDSGLRTLSNSVIHGREIPRYRYVSALVEEIKGKEDSPATTLRIFEAANMNLTQEERKLILKG